MSFLPALVLLLLAAAVYAVWRLIFHIPGPGYHAQLPPLTPREHAYLERTKAILHTLCHEIGERNVSRRYQALQSAAAYIERQLRAAGYQPVRQEFRSDRRTVANIIAELPGSDPGRAALIIGAHYDTVALSPGANDNGTAVAGGLAIAERIARMKPRRTVRFVFFVNEEAPYFGTSEMGSLVYAESCRAKEEHLFGAIILETIGCFTNAPNSQRYPKVLTPFFPTTGNFIAFVANIRSRTFLHRVARAFRAESMFPSEGIAAPEKIRDICRSDQYAFWVNGYPAVMVTDTANFRYPHYHTPDDTVDKINYDALARICLGLERVVCVLSKIRKSE